MLNKISSFFSSLKQEHIKNPQGFGTFSGVFVPNVTIMFGVIIFLRLHLVLGYLGLGATIAIIFAALLLMIVTSFSISSVVTNMQVGSGGTYYMISRSLGIEIGASIGVLLFLAQLISTSLCISGFAYSLQVLLPHLSVTFIEAVTLTILTAVVLTSSNAALKVQSFVLLILMAAYFSIIWGRIPDEGLLTTPFFPNGLGFWEGFALFFPALTGIEAGNALSGSLKRPAFSISIGNIASLLFMVILYIALVAALHYQIPVQYLKADPFLLLKYSRFESVALVGLWAATLSSALGALVSSPRILQAIAEDRVFPSFIAQTGGKHNDPRHATAIAVAGTVLVTLSTNIDQLIPVLTMISLITYATINFVAGISEIINHPSWRPALRPHWTFPILGSFGCLFVMFMINPGWSFASLLLLGIIWLLVRRRNIQSTFQDVRESIIFYFSRQTLYRLSSSIKHALHWHPQLLVFATAPHEKKELVFFSRHICQQNGILTFASIVPDAWSTEYKLQTTQHVLDDFFEKNNVHCLTQVQPASDSTEGILNLIKGYGIGPLQPNTIVVSHSDFTENLPSFFEIVETCELLKKNLVVYKDSDNKDLFDKKSVQLDLWWDHNCSASFNLMLSFILLIRESDSWKNTQICIQALANDEAKQESLTTYFSELIQQGRLNFKTTVHVAPNNTDYFANIKYYSYGTDCIFIAMPYPQQQEFIEKAFSSLLMQKSGALFFALDGIDHKELYH